MKRMRDPGSEPGERGFERVARERVGIDVRSQSSAQTHHRDPMNGCAKNLKNVVGFRVRRKETLLDDTLNVRRHPTFHFADEAESFPVLANRRDRSIEKHQREVLGMFLAERVEPPETSTNLLDGIGNRHFVARREKHPKPFLGERQKDVVFAFEVAIDGGGAVFDFFRDFANRNVLISLGNEQLARSVEDRPRDGLPFPFLTFSYAQSTPSLSELQR